jgi:hypothetical protein
MMTGIECPAVFKAVCRNIIQDYDLVAATPEDLVDFAIYDLGDAELGRLEWFLKDVLDGRYGDDELEALWSRTSAEIGFPEPGHLSLFLKLMLSRVARRLG